MQLLYSKCVRVGWVISIFGGDDDGEGEGDGGYSDRGAGMASGVGSVERPMLDSENGFKTAVVWG